MMDLLIEDLIPFAQESRSAWEENRLRFPPTDVFNKTSLLRAILDAYQKGIEYTDSPLFDLSGDSTYLLDAQMESPFAQRFDGDPLAEGNVQAGAVIGQFEKQRPESGLFKITKTSKEFVVLLPFLYDLPADGVTGFPWFNQIARTAAAMAMKLQDSGRGPRAMKNVSLLIVSTQKELRDPSSLLWQYARKPLIRDLVGSRVNCYREELKESYDHLYNWFNDFFRSFLRRLTIGCITWPSLASDSGCSDKLIWFYEGCLCFSNPEGVKPRKWFPKRPEDLRQLEGHYEGV